MTQSMESWQSMKDISEQMIGKMMVWNSQYIFRKDELCPPNPITFCDERTDFSSSSPCP